MPHANAAVGEPAEIMTEPVIRQATAVAINGRGLLLEGQPGSGKSTLALSLIDRGAQLIGDDGVSLTVDGNILTASAPPNIAGLIEVRGVGLIKRPHVSAPISLVLNLTQDAPRFVERADIIHVAGHEVPTLSFARYNEADPIRAEIALEVHGLPAAGQRRQ